MVLPAAKGHVTVVLNTNCSQKIVALLGAPLYRKLPKDPTESVEQQTTFLLKNLSHSEEVIQQLWTQGSRPLRLYGPPKIHKEEVPFGPILSTIWVPIYHLAQHLASLLSGYLGNSPHHVKNSEFIHTISWKWTDTAIFPFLIWYWHLLQT
jgi:hypothetical protein